MVHCRSLLRYRGVCSMLSMTFWRRCECIAVFTFSSTVMSPNSRTFWKVRAMPFLVM